MGQSRAFGSVWAPFWWTACYWAPSVLSLACSLPMSSPAGDFSEWNRTIAGGAFRITGSIELRIPRDDPRWQPTGNVWFIGTDSRKIGLQALVARDSPDRQQFRLRGPAAAGAPAVFASRNWKDGAVPFTLTLNGSGDLVVTVSNDAQSLPVGKVVVKKVALSCSTADFHFSDIIITTE